MQRYTVIFILLSVLYMFQAVFPPIIRSSKNCIHSIGCAVYTVLWAPDDGRKDRL